jgi:hypothetical protein
MHYRFALVVFLVAGCKAPPMQPGSPGAGDTDAGTGSDAGTASDCGGACPDGGMGSGGAIAFGAPEVDQAGPLGYAITIADLNGDNALDVVLSSSSNAGSRNEVHILLGSGAGGLTDLGAITTASPPNETVVADFDGDGIADIVGIGADGMGPLPDFYLQGQGNFKYAQSTWGDARDFNGFLTAADFDEDGTQDLLAAYKDDATQTGGFVILKMPGFTVIQNDLALGHTALQAVAGDFDGDGHQDVVAARYDSNVVRFYRGDGSGTVTFVTEVALPGGPVSEIRAFDLDGDGRSDLVALHGDGTATVSYATATGFAPALVIALPSAFFSHGMAAGDFNGDGRLDLAFGNSNFGDIGITPAVDVWRNTTAGFTHAMTLNVPAGVGEIRAADLNGDSRADLVVPGVGVVTVYLATP